MTSSNGSATALPAENAPNEASSRQMPAAIGAGDELACSATIVGVEQRRSGVRVSFDITTNQHHEVVALSRTLMLFRGVEVSDSAIAPPPWKGAAVDLDTSPCREKPIVLRPWAAHVFSECARNYNPIHTDISVATAAGLPGLILHGTATFA